MLSKSKLLIGLFLGLWGHILIWIFQIIVFQQWFQGFVSFICSGFFHYFMQIKINCWNIFESWPTKVSNEIQTNGWVVVSLIDRFLESFLILSFSIYPLFFCQELFPLHSWACNQISYICFWFFFVNYFYLLSPKGHIWSFSKIHK